MESFSFQEKLKSNSFPTVEGLFSNSKGHQDKLRIFPDFIEFGKERLAIDPKVLFKIKMRENGLANGI